MGGWVGGRDGSMMMDRAMDTDVCVCEVVSVSTVRSVHLLTVIYSLLARRMKDILECPKNSSKMLPKQMMDHHHHHNESIFFFFPPPPRLFSLFLSIELMLYTLCIKNDK